MIKIPKLFVFLLFASATSEANGKIEFKGVSQSYVRELRAQLPSLNQQASPAVLDQAIRLLYQTGEYENVKVFENQKNYTIEATPIKRVRTITITGNKLLSDSEVRQYLGVQPDDRFDLLKLEEGVDRLKDRYAQLGYLNSFILIDHGDSNNEGAILKINIQESTPCELKEIKFITNNTELQTQMSKRVSQYINKPLQNEFLTELAQDIQNFFIDNRYLVATLSSPEIIYSEDRTQARISYAIERPFKFVLLFDGNKFFQTNEIIRGLGVNSNNPTGSNPAAELAERIKQMYLSKGFSNIDIKFSEQVFTQTFTRRINFVISEGPRVRIRNIEVLGQISRPQSFYTDFLSSSSSIGSYGYYNRNELDKGIENLIFELQNQGYLKARVQSTRVEYSARRDFVKIQMLLDEGPLTKIQKLEFKGNSVFSDKQLREVIDLYPDTPLSLKKLEDSLKLLQDHYTNLGYLDMQILSPNSSLVTYSEDNTKASVVYDIYEGPQVKVASITVEGNEKTQSYVILNELEFETGDVLTPSLINDSIYRLQRSGLFSEVSIATLEKGTQIAERTVLVRVGERYPGLFTSGIGVNSEFDLTVRGYLGIGYRNLGGTARALTGRAELKRVQDVEFLDHKITAGYLEPFLFNSKTRGRINLTRSYSIVERNSAAQQILAQESNVLELLLEREFFRHLKITWNLWSIAYERDFEIDEKREETSKIIATIGPTVELDYRDNPFNPTSGHFTRINSEYSHPSLGSNRYIQYIRTNAVVSHYMRLGSPRFVWANSARGGFIRNLDSGANEDRGVPESKMFFLGGRSTVRGFDPREIPRRSSYAREDQAYYLQTESHFYLVKSEIRFPIYGDLGGVLFYDGGAVKILGKDIEPDYRDAAGVGIRYNTPVGPVSAEYGYKLRRIKEIGEAEGRFHFSIGTF